MNDLHDWENLGLFLKNSFKDPTGRAFFLDLIGQTGVFSPTYQHDPIIQAFIDGQRKVGLMIFNLLEEHIPQELYNALRERAFEAHEQKRERLENDRPNT